MMQRLFETSNSNRALRILLQLTGIFLNNKEMLEFAINKLSVVTVADKLLSTSSDPKDAVAALKFFRTLAFSDDHKDAVWTSMLNGCIPRLRTLTVAPYISELMAELIFGTLAVMALHRREVPENLWKDQNFSDYCRVTINKLKGKSLVQLLQFVRNSVRHKVKVDESIVNEIKEIEGIGRDAQLIADIIRMTELVVE